MANVCVCEHDKGNNIYIRIYFQAFYESLHHSYLANNKVDKDPLFCSGPGDTAEDRTAEVMKAILQVETSKRKCVIM